MIQMFKKIFGTAGERKIKQMLPVVEQINSLEPKSPTEIAPCMSLFESLQKAGLIDLPADSPRPVLSFGDEDQEYQAAWKSAAIVIEHGFGMLTVTLCPENFSFSLGIAPAASGKLTRSTSFFGRVPVSFSPGRISVMASAR